MSWKIFGIAVLVIIFVCIAGGNEQSGKIEQNVREIAEERGEVRAFIEINEKPLFNKNELKAEIIDKIGKEKVMYEFEESISAVIGEEDIVKLENDWRVENVKLVGIRQVFLQDSVPLINASASRTLQVSGINLTGAGQSVCIIDSGVNYSHPDLGGCWGGSNLSSSCKVWGGRDYCADDASCTTEDNDPLDSVGHGTHVSGIAAANGGIIGVASQARIIMIKACNSSGSCFDDAILSGIEWCVNNASIFNISVISMSLGGGAYSAYCNNDPLANSINNAVGNGIVVLAATGNTGFTDKIAGPACVENATAVGSIRKDDSTIDYNRNSLVKLIAPGYAINSTYINSASGYLSIGGTSMATPHVAGAVAIVKQFLSLKGLNKTAKEIESSLNNTGRRIYDSASGLTFSRINVYAAVISLDNTAPVAALVSPANNAVGQNANQSFRCNATDLALKNVTFYLWNSSGVYNTTSSNIGSGFNQFEVNLSNMQIGSYKWNCLYYDENFNSGFAQSNFTFTIGSISVDLITPADNNYTNINASVFRCDLSSDLTNALVNSTFYLWNSSSQKYSQKQNISGVTNTSFFNYSFSIGGAYKWNCFATNNNSNFSFAQSNFTITFDQTTPIVNIIGPVSGYSLSGAGTVTFEYNTSDNYGLRNCNLILDGVSAASNSSRISNETNNISYALDVGSHSWGVNCTDLAGNSGNSSFRALVVNSLPGSSLSSGSGGGSVIKKEVNNTYTAANAELNSGYSKELKKNDRVKFVIFDKLAVNHTLTIENIGDNFVNISIRSDPLFLILGIGQSVKLNLSSPDYYDFFVRIDSINNGKVNITLQLIYEGRENKKKEETPGVRELFEEITPEEKENGKDNYFAYFIIALIALGVILLSVRAMEILTKREIKKEIKKEIMREIKRKRKKN